MLGGQRTSGGVGVAADLWDVYISRGKGVGGGLVIQKRYRTEKEEGKNRVAEEASIRMRKEM